MSNIPELFYPQDDRKRKGDQLYVAVKPEQKKFQAKQK
jgi:hypothetical protein